MQLPNRNLIEVSQDKIVGYLLNAEHPEGAGKARFFTSLGFNIDRWQDLAERLQRMAVSSSGVTRVDSEHGEKYILEGTLATPGGRSVQVRTIWIIDRGAQVPRLVTAYPQSPEPS